MIKTAADFSTAISSVEEEITSSELAIEEKMSSSSFNDICKSIEGQLNSLYEKIRLLEDIQAYSREFVIKEVRDKKEKFNERLKVIEDVTDSYQDTSHITYLVPFSISSDIVRDRDGTIVSPMDITNSRLTMPGSTLQTAAIKSVMRTSSAISYNSNTDNLVDGKSCRSFYLEDEPVVGGITEDYVVMFKNPIKGNWCDIELSNCVLDKCAAINLENVEENMDFDKSYFEHKNITGLKFSVVSKNYLHDTGISNQSATGKDNFCILAEKASRPAQRADTIKQLMTESSETARSTEDEAFRAEYQQWLQAKEKSEAKNKLVEEGQQ